MDADGRFEIARAQMLEALLEMSVGLIGELDAQLVAVAADADMASARFVIPPVADHRVAAFRRRRLQVVIGHRVAVRMARSTERIRSASRTRELLQESIARQEPIRAALATFQASARVREAEAAAAAEVAAAAAIV